MDNIKMEEVSIDKEYISDLIAVHGMVDAFAIMETCFGPNMNYSIGDPELRIMMWQIQHSISSIRKHTNIMNFDPEFLNSLAERNSSKDIISTIMIRHLIGALDSLDDYLNKP